MDLVCRSPFPEYAWPRVWQWIQPFIGRVSDDFSPATQDAFVEGHLARLHSAETWGVWRGDDLGGLIWIEMLNPVLAQTHVIFKKEFWGRATTETAIRDVYGKVFEAGVQKITSYVFENNHAILALAKAVGARQEGLLRNQTLQRGVPVNMIAIGLLKEDFYANGTDRRGDHGRGLTGGGTARREENATADHDDDEHPDVLGGPDGIAGPDAERAERPAVESAGSVHGAEDGRAPGQ